MEKTQTLATVEETTQNLTYTVKLEKVAQQRVFDAWAARKPWDDTHGDHEDRLVEAVFDDADRLVRVDFIRIAVHDGWITPEARDRATLRRWRHRTALRPPITARAGPMSIWSQLTIALDSILTNVRFGAGGLISMSEQLDIPVPNLLRQYASVLNSL